MLVSKIELGGEPVKHLITEFIDEQGLPRESFWNALEDFGIYKSDLKKLNLSFNKLYEILYAVKAYQECLRYLKNLKKPAFQSVIKVG